jgi:hypothetical protein
MQKNNKINNTKIAINRRNHSNKTILKLKRLNQKQTATIMYNNIAISIKIVLTTLIKKSGGLMLGISMTGH